MGFFFLRFEGRFFRFRAPDGESSKRRVGLARARLPPPSPLCRAPSSHDPCLPLGHNSSKTTAKQPQQKLGRNNNKKQSNKKTKNDATQSYTPNTTDLPGRRYAYGRQPAVLQWNVLMLANALYASGVVSREDAEGAVARYAPALMEAYEGWTARKLGFFPKDDKKTGGGDKKETSGGDDKSGKSGDGSGDGNSSSNTGGPLAGALLEAMQQDKADFTNTWRALASVPLEPEARENEGGLPRALEAALASSPIALSDPSRLAAWRQWLGAWRAALRAEGGPSADDARRQALQRSASPKYVPRQHLLQEAIAAAESGDETELERLLAAVTRPYDEQDGKGGDGEGPATDAKYASPPPPAFSCMLSCSS
jgi:serine/tyrosine/threonine adenylyltransferase